MSIRRSSGTSKSKRSRSFNRQFRKSQSINEQSVSISTRIDDGMIEYRNSIKTDRGTDDYITAYIEFNDIDWEDFGFDKLEDFTQFITEDVEELESEVYHELDIILSKLQRDKELSLYRAVSLNDPNGNDLNYDNLGIYWTDDESYVDTYWSDGKEPFVITAKITNIDDIDIKGTILAKMNYSTGRDEREIRLRDKSRITITSIKNSDDKEMLHQPKRASASEQKKLGR